MTKKRGLFLGVRLRGEQFLQDGERPAQCGRGEASQPSHELFPIDRTDLVEDQEPCFASEPAGDPSAGTRGFLRVRRLRAG